MADSKANEPKRRHPRLLPSKVTEHPAGTSQEEASTLAYWTKERMSAAEPVGLERDPPEGVKDNDDGDDTAGK